MLRMRKRRYRPHFATETRQCRGIASEAGRQDFQRDVAAEARVVRAVDFAHTTGAYQFDNAVPADLYADEVSRPGGI